MRFLLWYSYFKKHFALEVLFPVLAWMVPVLINNLITINNNSNLSNSKKTCYFYWSMNKACSMEEHIFKLSLKVEGATVYNAT